MRGLAARVARLERVRGTPSAPSEREFQEALALLRRHGAVKVAEILGSEADPNEAALMEAAEEAGEIEAAGDIKRRYWLARGVDIEERERRDAEESMAWFREVFGIEEDGPSASD